MFYLTEWLLRILWSRYASEFLSERLSSKEEMKLIRTQEVISFLVRYKEQSNKGDISGYLYPRLKVHGFPILLIVRGFSLPPRTGRNN
jgi:hypothetical protein